MPETPKRKRPAPPAADAGGPPSGDAPAPPMPPAAPDTTDDVGEVKRIELKSLIVAAGYLAYFAEPRDPRNPVASLPVAAWGLAETAHGTQTVVGFCAEGRLVMCEQMTNFLGYGAAGRPVPRAIAEAAIVTARAMAADAGEEPEGAERPSPAAAEAHEPGPRDMRPADRAVGDELDPAERAERRRKLDAEIARVRAANAAADRSAGAGPPPRRGAPTRAPRPARAPSHAPPPRIVPPDGA